MSELGYHAMQRANAAQNRLWEMERRQQVIERFRFRCWYCGVGLTIHGDGQNRRTKDHVQPISRGGGTDGANIVYACKRCNHEKKAFTLEEYRAQKGGVVFFGERGPESNP